MIESFSHTVYFAPRGKDRIQHLGNHISQRHLKANDKLIGLIGKAGAGKSLLIKGMFPGLNLTNDDEGINLRPLPVLDEFEEGKFRSHSYHVDIRFETAFSQPWELGKAIDKAIKKNRRVIVEHFDLIAPYLDAFPDVLVGIGEEVILARPGVFGPTPEEIKDVVFDSIENRFMAHSAEDLTAMVIEKRGYMRPPLHSDVKSGFVLQFDQEPDFSIEEIEEEVQELIASDEKIKFLDDDHIEVGEEKYVCTGPRIHVGRTGDISDFRLLKEYKRDPVTGFYLLVGIVGERRGQLELSCGCR